MVRVSGPITSRKEVKPMIGPGNSHHFFNQSESKLKPIVTWALDFSSTSNGLIIFDIFSSSGWLLCLLQFGFTPLNHKALNKYFSIKPLCKDLCSDSSLPDRWRRPVAVHENLLPLQYIYLTRRFGLWYCWIFLRGFYFDSPYVRAVKIRYNSSDKLFIT